METTVGYLSVFKYVWKRKDGRNIKEEDIAELDKRAKISIKESVFANHGGGNLETIEHSGWWGLDDRYAEVAQ